MRFDQLSRRELLAGTAASLAYFTTPGLFAEELEELLLTPRQTEGPFYPDRLPLDRDNDLIIVQESLTPALGQVLHLGGRVLSSAGEPIRNAEVEIWQVDNNGVYIHSRSAGKGNSDKYFQGYGKFETDSTGFYYFRTIRPVPYPGRTPHIHFKVNVKGRNVLTSQFYIDGESQNARDGVYRGIGSREKQELVTLKLHDKPKSKIDEKIAEQDIIIGFTPDESRAG
ncbi:dioxygenase family protein [Calycomorphotria hydatis]|uniref:Protocatechuate 3,4-dioxygenase beta chain n=1 Tax=Calycomorphotria hydatis TaxID=2528027 RepID=A0A517T946_9PLAN|nr:intradiol ring-cleavage dioxygenase [Calycomorphotria hydatis]QDT64878.1 Protocatechuate 3,4-dioxygenase beta chain [Calycomorphotria hydatis]